MTNLNEPMPVSGIRTQASSREGTPMHSGPPDARRVRTGIPIVAVAGAVRVANVTRYTWLGLECRPRRRQKWLSDIGRQCGPRRVLRIA